MIYKCENIVKKYDKKIVLNKLSFSITQNKVTCILGHNGSGKTTLIKS